MPDVTYIEAILRHEDAEMVEFHGGEAALARPTEYPRGAALGPTGATAEMPWIGGEFPDDPPRFDPLADDRLRIREQNRLMDQVERTYEHAMKRSRELLLDHLDLEQRMMFEQSAMFFARGNKTRTLYEIRTMATSNVWSETGYTYCAVLTGVPIYDQLLAQKLTIEHDEPSFLKIAIRNSRRDGPWAVRHAEEQRKRQRWENVCEWVLITCGCTMIVGSCWGIYEMAASLWKLILRLLA